jgi:hypothetical protein
LVDVEVAPCPVSRLRVLVDAKQMRLVCRSGLDVLASFAL